MDHVEELIADALQQMAVKAQQDGCSTTEWTRRVKQAIVGVGRQLGWLTAASQCESDNGKEWLYDVVWYQQNESRYLTDVSLVAESEWGWVKEDFEKLLVARAKYRVMVFESPDVPAVFAQARLWIHTFRLTQAGDRYLLAGWTGTDLRFELVVV